jgi:hypothetical protein
MDCTVRRKTQDIKIVARVARDVLSCFNFLEPRNLVPKTRGLFVFLVC